MIYELGRDIDTIKAFETIGCDRSGAQIMSTKSTVRLFLIKNISVKAANILKQDTLSIGADLAVSKEASLLGGKDTDALLMVTDKQLELLAKKELLQPFGLKLLGKELKKFQKTARFEPQIMGVLNINEDSFYEKSRVDASHAAQRIQKMIDDGAHIVDIGAVSSRPSSQYPGEYEEFERIAPVIDEIYRAKLYEKAEFSVDSFSANVVRYALDKGFKIVNDIQGLRNDEVAKIAGEYDVRVVIMHMQGDPSDMQNSPQYDDVIMDVENFFTQRIEKAKSFGVSDIVLDVGIGFGKNRRHNLLLLKHLRHFSHFNLPLLIGASRKSIIADIYPSAPHERLPGTLALHMHSLNEGAGIIRCHDVAEHAQMISVYKALRDTVF